MDDDPLPKLRIGDAAVIEGGTAVFTLSLSKLSARAVTLAYLTANNTATSPADYTASSGSLTFAPGQTRLTLGVATKADMLLEGSESFFVNIGSAPFADAVDPQGVGTILAPPPPLALSLSVRPQTFLENAGTNAATATLSHSGSTSTALTVKLSSSNTAKAKVQASVTIPKGAQSVTVPVAAVDNALVDGNKTVELRATSEGYTAATLNVTVKDNDTPSGKNS